MKRAFFRFYEELNDFLPRNRRKIKFEHSFTGRSSIKDMIESLGVPHTEIDMLLVNGISVDFNYIVEDSDIISVYPVFESFDISNVQKLRAKSLREPRFILDVHLGTLARYLRMLGYDCLYKNNYLDEAIVSLSLENKRTILTRDLGILKRREVEHGYWVRNSNPELQLGEIVNRFDLKNGINEFSRCIICNTRLERVEKERIIDRIPKKVKSVQKDFYFCGNCDKIFWKGTHYIRMRKIIDSLND